MLFLCRPLARSIPFCRYGKAYTPGPQGGPGRSRRGDMSKFYVVRGPGGFAPWSASTASKRWHLSCLLLSVTKEVRPTAAGRKISRQKRKSKSLFLLPSFSDERRKPLRQNAAKNTARNSKKPQSQKIPFRFPQYCGKLVGFSASSLIL